MAYEAPAVAERLRTLADWLDAHPGAVVHGVNFIDATGDGVVVVNSYVADTVEEMAQRAGGLGGSWDFEASETTFEQSQMIAPGLRFRFFISRAKVDRDGDAA